MSTAETITNQDKAQKALLDYVDSKAKELFRDRFYGEIILTITFRAGNIKTTDVVIKEMQTKESLISRYDQKQVVKP